MGFSLPAYLHLRHRSDGSGVIRLFWLGVAIGLTWEIPIFLSALFAADPIVGFLREPPLHPFVFMVAHSFWDGGIFLAGLGLVRALCPHPVLAAFRWRELAVLIAWGQASELAVEITSVLNQGWVYSDVHAWNPVLFHVVGHPITLVPQLIWLAAPIAYYLAASRLARRGVRASVGYPGARLGSRRQSAGQSADPDPASVVEAYFSRMRARDPGVADLFGDDAVLIGLGEERRGRDAIREFYRVVIERAGPLPRLGGALLVEGARVAAEIYIDFPNGSVLHAVDLFQVEGGLIRSLTYFIAND